jgi:hypothetical protein
MSYNIRSRKGHGRKYFHFPHSVFSSFLPSCLLIFPPFLALSSLFSTFYNHVFSSFLHSSPRFLVLHVYLSSLSSLLSFSSLSLHCILFFPPPHLVFLAFSSFLLPHSVFPVFSSFLVPHSVFIVFSSFLLPHSVLPLFYSFFFPHSVFLVFSSFLLPHSVLPILSSFLTRASLSSLLSSCPHLPFLLYSPFFVPSSLVPPFLFSSYGTSFLCPHSFHFVTFRLFLSPH